MPVMWEETEKQTFEDEFQCWEGVLPICHHREVFKACLESLEPISAEATI